MKDSENPALNNCHNDNADAVNNRDLLLDPKARIVKIISNYN
ncbi:MAG: hypothetical protein ACXAC7_19190 [Candidatus Hodarchaeales archaeon]